MTQETCGSLSGGSLFHSSLFRSSLLGTYFSFGAQHEANQLLLETLKQMGKSGLSVLHNVVSSRMTVVFTIASVFKLPGECHA